MKISGGPAPPRPRRRGRGFPRAQARTARANTVRAAPGRSARASPDLPRSSWVNRGDCPGTREGRQADHVRRDRRAVLVHVAAEVAPRPTPKAPMVSPPSRTVVEAEGREEAPVPALDPSVHQPVTDRLSEERGGEERGEDPEHRCEGEQGARGCGLSFASAATPPDHAERTTEAQERPARPSEAGAEISRSGSRRAAWSRDNAQ